MRSDFSKANLIEEKERFMEEQKMKMEEDRANTIRAMKSQLEREMAEVQQIRSYAEPILEAQAQKAPRHPLSHAQIEHAVVIAEIARRAMAAQQTQSSADALLQVSARPKAQLRQESLEQSLETSVPTPRPPRL